MIEALSIASIAVLFALIVLHTMAAFYYGLRVWHGHNGVTLSMFFHLCATVLLLSVEVSTVFVFQWWYSAVETWLPYGQTVTLISRVIPLVTVSYLVMIARVEAGKPLRRDTTTRRKLFNLLGAKDDTQTTNIKQ